MNGEYTMDHYGGMYDDGGREYHHNLQQNNFPPLLMLFIILCCSLSINLLRCSTYESGEEGPLLNQPVLEKKEITTEELLNEHCVICLDSFQKKEKVATLQCEHTFHFDCMQMWTKTNNTCPLCRGGIPII